MYVRCAAQDRVLDTDPIGASESLRPAAHVSVKHTDGFSGNIVGPHAGNLDQNRVRRGFAYQPPKKSSEENRARWGPALKTLM